MRLLYVARHTWTPDDLPFRESMELSQKRVQLKRAIRRREREKLESLVIPEGSKLKWSDDLGKMVWG